MSTASEAEKSAVNGIRTALGIGGVLAVIAGILVLLFPRGVAAVAVAIIAVYAIAAGLVYGGLGIFTKGKGGWARIGHILLGLLFIIAGIVALFNLPGATAWFAALFGIFVGIAWIIEGIVALSTLNEAASKVWTVIFAVLSIIAGIILLFSPLWGAAVLFWLLGITLIVLGIINIVRAFTFGKGDL